MKKIGFILAFLISTLSAFGQQFLWSTQKDSIVEHLEHEQVIDKVLEYYDFYDMYFDGTGYSKAGFFNAFESSETSQGTDTSIWLNLKESIQAVDSITVFAFKTNSGTGSSILVLCVDDKNVDMLVFSNSYDTGAILAVDFKREKFKMWFKTLLH